MPNTTRDVSAGLAVAALVSALLASACSPDPGDTAYPLDPIEMVYVEPGTFTMGSPEDEVGRDEWGYETQHEVTLTRGFWISKYELTEQQYWDYWLHLFWDSSDTEVPDNWSASSGCHQCPVGEPWHHAANLANYVSKAEGLDECFVCASNGTDCSLKQQLATPYDCPGYRLPTDAEWEYAARAGTTSAFSNGGNLQPGTQDACDPELVLDNGERLADFAWFCTGDEDEDQAHPVGLLSPNPWGLHDMYGNLEEWCYDMVGVATSEAQVDPVFGPASKYGPTRGGMYNDEPADLRSATRSGAYAQDGTAGIRLVRTASPGEG